jgi:hypothetical protein
MYVTGNASCGAGARSVGVGDSHHVARAQRLDPKCGREAPDRGLHAREQRADSGIASVIAISSEERSLRIDDVDRSGANRSTVAGQRKREHDGPLTHHVGRQRSGIGPGSGRRRPRAPRNHPELIEDHAVCRRAIPIERNRREFTHRALLDGDGDQRLGHLKRIAVRLHVHGLRRRCNDQNCRAHHDRISDRMVHPADTARDPIG